MSLGIGVMTYNGVTIGPGGIADLVSCLGLTGLPLNRNGDLPRPNAHGQLAGYDFMGSRPVTLKLEVLATPGGNNQVQNLETLRQAFLMDTTTGGGMNPPAGQQLVFNFNQGSGGVGTNRQVTCRCRKFEDTVDIAFAGGGFAGGIVTVDVLMDAVDPLIYDANTQTANTGLTASSGGLAFPVTPPFTFGTQSGGLITAVNSGTIACPPYMTITGPCQNPKVQQQTTGVTLQFNTTLNTGDTLAVDCYNGSAVLNGTASRLNALAAGSFITSFQIPPGSNTIGFFSSDSSPTGSTLTVNWSNTWS